MAGDAVVLRPEGVWPSHNQGVALVKSDTTGPDTTLDHFIVRDGATFAGTHVIIDLWDAEGLDDLARMEAAFRETVETCGATLLHIHLHHFTPNDGISGVAVLAESHISVHTWPERGFAAFDVFMCGDSKPELAVGVLSRYFKPKSVTLNELRRGTIEPGSQGE